MTSDKLAAGDTVRVADIGEDATVELAVAALCRLVDAEGVWALLELTDATGMQPAVGLPKLRMLREFEGKRVVGVPLKSLLKVIVADEVR